MEAQQRAGSLPHRSVTSQRDRSAGKASDQEVERFLQIIDLIKPHAIWIILVAVAIYDYIHTSNVLTFLVLIAAATGSISLLQAIDLLRGRSIPISPPSEEANDQPTMQH